MQPSLFWEKRYKGQFMKKYGKVILLCAVLLCMSALVIYWQNHRYTSIDQWSSQLVPEKVEWAQVSVRYGVEEHSYNVTEEEYPLLIDLLKTVTEDVSSRKDVSRRLEDGQRLAFFYEGKLWLFKCCEDSVVSLTFQDMETGKQYGCEGTQLYIWSLQLWEYIMEIAKKAK